MPVNDQFKQMGRIPLKPLPYSKKELAQCNEILIDYDNDKTYHIYLVDSNDKTKIIDLTQLIIDNLFADSSINANNFRINIEGILNPETLHNIINFIYKRFLMPENQKGFEYERDYEKLIDPDTKHVLLKDTDGIIYLPVTTIDNIFCRNGESLEEKLKNMSRVGFSSDYIRADYDNQTSFHFTYPFPDYSKAGNHIEVRIGSTFIDNSRYEIIDDEEIDGKINGATITFIDESIKKDRAINFLFIYNCKDTNDNRYDYIYGGHITNRSIPITKLQKKSDSFMVNDGSSVATSKALYNLFNKVIDLQIKNTDKYVICNDKSTDPNKIQIKIEQELQEGMIFEIGLHSKKSSNAKLIINDTEYIIHTFDAQLNKQQLPSNVLVKFMYYNKTIYLAEAAATYPSRYIYTCKDQEVEIPFVELNYSINNCIFVYRNGVRLFEDLDYFINWANRTITLFVRTEEGERIVFEAN